MMEKVEGPVSTHLDEADDGEGGGASTTNKSPVGVGILWRFDFFSGGEAEGLGERGDFWRRHKRNVFVTVGVVGSGYFLYKLYDTHRRSLADLERQLAYERENEELVKAQMQAHFENIQRVADTMTLPHAVHFLNGRIAEELDHSDLIENLTSAKGQLSNSEKLELWDRLKILSFTRIVISIWTATMISLYIRVQVNIVGRHLYIDAARGLGSSDPFEDADLVDWDGLQKFLASAEFLANDGLSGLISSIQTVAGEVLKGRQLRDTFKTTTLRDTIMQILDMFMGEGRPQHWVDYLMPMDDRLRMLATDSGSHVDVPAGVTIFDQLMMEARTVLSSTEFGGVMEASIKVLVDALVDDMAAQSVDGSLTSGMPLVKLLPRVAQMGPSLLIEPSENQYIDLIRRIPEVEVFFTLLYANPVGY